MGSVPVVVRLLKSEPWLLMFGWSGVSMRANAPEVRKKVWLLIHTIVESRLVGRLPAKRSEIMHLSGLDKAEVLATIKWLKEHELIASNGDGYSTQYKAFDPNKICWRHGVVAKPCSKCNKGR